MATINKKEESKDPGFGTKVTAKNQRLINADGSFNVEITGQPLADRYHLYHNLITMSWRRFTFIVIFFYLLSNIFFAFIYVAIGTEHLAGVIGTSPAERFMEAFFFSAQTVTTVGYGRISPVGFLTSLVAATESLLGLLGFALATGLLYGRFSKPEAKILYSRNAVIGPYREITGFMLRVANKRRSKLIELEAQLLLSFNETKDGKTTRQFHTLGLERSKINLIPTSWTIVHPIDENSPIYNVTIEQLKETDAEFLVMLKAFDETFSQTVYSRSSYRIDEVVSNARFENIIVTNGEGVTTMLYDKFHDFVPLN